MFALNTFPSPFQMVFLQLSISLGFPTLYDVPGCSDSEVGNFRPESETVAPVFCVQEPREEEGS